MKRLIIIPMTLALLLSNLSFAFATDGTYTATAPGFGGDVAVTIAVEGDAIKDVAVDSTNETAGFGLEAGAVLATQLLGAQGTSIDGVSGVTVTSEAAKTAMLSAMQEAGIAQAGQAHYTPGTYTGSSLGRIADVTVEVTVSGTAIESVSVSEHAETEAIAMLPLAQIPADIVAYQSLGVDTITGATSTSYAIINAAAEALEKAGADVAQLRAVQVPEKEIAPVADMTTQVVVAGSGVAGLTAAITAANEGASVILVEKLPFVGGTLATAGGGGTTVQSNLWPNEPPTDLDSVMDYLRDYNATSLVHQLDYDFAASVLSKSGLAINYLVDELKIPFTASSRGTYIRATTGTGSQETLHYKAAAEKLGVTILLNTTAQDILMQDGAAVGLKVSAAGGEYSIHADKVIIATGGATYDTERMLAHNPELAIVSLSTQPLIGSTGDGFRMLEEIGAAMGDGPIVKSAYPDYSPLYHFTWANIPLKGDKLFLNAQGVRFANENPTPGALINMNKFMLRNPSPAYYVLYDAASVPESLLTLSDRDDPSIIVQGDTIEIIAEKTGMDIATLRATFDRYQEMCANGVDADFDKQADSLVAYGEGPYYAAYLSPATWGTIGGALTDEQFHVLSAADNTAIDNLFAIGECATSTLFSDYYMGSFSLGYYRTMGVMSGQTAVAEINAAK